MTRSAVDDAPSCDADAAAEVEGQAEDRERVAGEDAERLPLDE